MNFCKYVFLIAIIGCAKSNFLAAQTDKATFGIMPTLNVTIQPMTPLTLSFFAYDISATQNKINSDGTDFRNKQLYTELAAIYDFNAHWSGVLAYAFQRDYPLGDEHINEHRLFQEIIRKDQVGGGTLRNRLRIEERFIENRLTKTYPYSTRLRYLLGYVVPLADRKCFLSVYNDIFLGAQPKSDPLWNENWAYLGVGIKIGKGIVEPGVLWQNYAIGNNLRHNQWLFELTYTLNL